MTKLEQSFADLCAKHDLVSLSLGYTPESHHKFCAYAHGPNKLCAQAIGTTSAEAVSGAIAGLHAKRMEADPPAFADEPLQVAA